MCNQIARRMAKELAPALKAAEDVEYTDRGKDDSGKPHRMANQNADFDRWLKI